jgi:hypothetical protein
MTIKLINKDKVKEIEYTENTKIEDILKKEKYSNRNSSD